MAVPPQEELKSFLVDQRTLLVEILEANEPYYADDDVFYQAIKATVAVAVRLKKDIAEALGIHHGELTKMIRGERLPSARNMTFRLALIQKAITLLKRINREET